MALLIGLTAPAVDAQVAYYLNWGNRVYSVDLDQSPPVHTLISELSGTGLQPNGIAELPDGRIVYSTNELWMAVMNPDGSGKTRIQLFNPWNLCCFWSGVTVSDTHIFFSKNRNIYRVPIDFGGAPVQENVVHNGGYVMDMIDASASVEVVASNVGTNTYDPYDMKIDGSTGRLYFTNRGNSASETAIKYIEDASGAGPHTVQTLADVNNGIGGPLTFAIDEDGQQLFYVNYSGQYSIQKLDIASLNRSTIFTHGGAGMSMNQGIAYDPATDHIYFAGMESGDGRGISRIPASGGAATQMTTQADQGWAMLAGELILATGGSGGGPSQPMECIVNGSFEEPNVNGGFAVVQTVDVPGWNTVNFQAMEFIPAWWGAHPDGSQAIELYSFGPETIYQDFETTPGDVLTYSFYHLVNLNTFQFPQITENLVEVRFGSPGATVAHAVHGGSQAAQWIQYTGSYTVPAGQTVTRFEIAGIEPSINMGTGSALDAISVQGSYCPPADGTGGPVDSDGDGTPDDQDAFPNDPNETTDSDGDGVGDNGDAFPNDPNETADSDGDGVGDNGDAFPNDANESADSDGDGVGDNGDAFPNDANESADSDGDGVGDNGDAFPNDPDEDTDSDGDGVGDNGDAFPNDPGESSDADGDGVGDNADPDDDGNGLPDLKESVIPMLTALDGVCVEDASGKSEKSEKSGKSSKKSDKSSKKSGKSDKGGENDLAKAIDRIERSLDPKLWTDASHPDSKHGHKIFDEEKKAVKELQDLIGSTSNCDNVLQQAIDALVATDLMLVDVAISEVSCSDKKCSKDLAKAEEARADALAYLDEGREDKAIDELKYAWQKVKKHASTSNSMHVDQSFAFTAETDLHTAELPGEFSLEGNYPNPFNPQTSITFSMPEAATVRLTVYDLLGRQVALLVDGNLSAGKHEVRFDATNLPSGQYLYRLTTPKGEFTKMMMLLK